MKRKNWLQKLIVIVAVLLLVLCLVTGAPMKTDEASMQSMLWLLALIAFIGSVGFSISEKVKPLDWVILGSFIGACICLCEVLGISNGGFPAGLLFFLFLIEFLLSAGYRIGRWLRKK